MNFAVGLIRAGSMVFGTPRKASGWRDQSGAVVNGSYKVNALPCESTSPRKSPLRISAVGTDMRVVVFVTKFVASQFQKKKVRLRPLYSFGIITGPPSERPYSLRFTNGALS